MTICIGAICSGKDGRPARAVVVAADRMVTWGDTEFEHEVPKVMNITDRIVALVAGQTLRGSRVVRELAAHFHGSTPSVEDVAKAVADRYGLLRRQQIAAEIFAARGIDMQQFYEGLQTRLVAQLALGLDNLAVAFNFGVDLLIAGTDDSGGHLFYVGNPGGSFTDFYQIGFAAVGSGTLHAQQSMIGFAHTSARGLQETIFTVYASKKRAEAAPGVGKDTDITVIGESGTYRITDEALKSLEAVWLSYHKPLAQDLKEQVSQLKLIQEEGNHGEAA